MDGSGNGLLYLGSLIYRKNGSSTSLESACFDGGRFVVAEGSGGEAVVPQIHVTDHLGSIRAIVDAVSGEAIETNDFYPFGKRWDDQASLYDQSNRYRFNGKEEQSSLYPASYGSQVSYIDYGARHYDPVIGRWITKDSLAEKYYGTSPYAFCNNNPVNYVDPDGRAIETLWDIASIGIGVRSFVRNVKSGNVSGAVEDAVGIAVDAVAAAVPFLPGGVGAVRAGAKAVNAIDNAADAVKSAERVDDVGKIGDNVLETGQSVFKNRVKLRNKTKEIIRENAPTNTEGRFLDPNTNLPIEPGEEVFGHKYGHEWKRYKADPVNQGKSRKEVIEEQNNPYIYQIEDRQSNASHKYEKK